MWDENLLLYQKFENPSTQLVSWVYLLIKNYSQFEFHGNDSGVKKRFIQGLYTVFQFTVEF